MKTPLGRVALAEFLRRYWQKRPLLVHGALPECAAMAQRETLFALSGRDDMESRLVTRRGSRWQVRHGPFDPRGLARLPRSGWTLLVQGMDHALPAARRLLDRFSFIPHARVDDVMASYAPAGAGVGPHFDEYDVFLVQGAGRRRWQVGWQDDLDLVPGAPLKLLRRFRPRYEWVLGPGDVLYLPPRWAHDGVAMDGDCITWSVGFRASAAQELGQRFLDYLQERLDLPGIYADPGLRPARHPGRLGEDMVRHAVKTAGRIRWRRADVADFLGRHLTEPKTHVLFRRPRRALAPRAFAAALAHRGAALAPQTRMLFRGRALFINGESVAAGAGAARLLAGLADRRALPPRARPGKDAARLLYRWYRAGYICLTSDQ